MHCKLMALIYYQRVKCRSPGACAANPEHLKNLNNLFSCYFHFRMQNSCPWGVFICKACVYLRDVSLLLYVWHRYTPTQTLVSIRLCAYHKHLVGVFMCLFYKEYKTCVLQDLQNVDVILSAITGQWAMESLDIFWNGMSNSLTQVCYPISNCNLLQYKMNHVTV